MPAAAIDLAEELGEQLFYPHGARKTVVTGAPGTGKTAVLEDLAARAAERGQRWMRLSPSSSDLDGPANALAQGAASMRERGVNGVLDPVFDPAASFDTKLDAFGRGLASLDETLVLLDIPDSWARPSRLVRDGGTFAYQGHQIAREVLAQGARHRIVLAASHGVESSDASEYRLPRDRGDESLGSIYWGRFLSFAEPLRTLLSPGDLRKLTPLELRVAVALRALGFDDRVVKNACRASWPELRRMLQVLVQSRPWLNEAFFVLSHARIAVGPQLLQQLLAQCRGRDESSSRAVLMDVLLMSDGASFVFHSRLRAVEPKLDSPRRRELADLINRQLAEAWAQLATPRSWHGVVAWWESLHHWAEAGEESRIEETPDISMWTTLGRRRSLQGDYETAVRAFRRALELQPNNSYAHEYLAYNLDRSNRDIVDAERSFRRAVELEPQNPWWNRRLVQALQRRGKIDAAWDAWIAALDRLDETTETSEWIQQNLHKGVCQGFLARGQNELAAAVLDTIPRDNWIPDFVPLWNVICHRREAMKLEASLFPESVDFERRWQGPRLGGDTSPVRWYPGRIIDADEDEITLELAEPPDQDELPQLFGLVLGRTEFLEQTDLPKRAVLRPGTFVELHLLDDESQRIYIDPSSFLPRGQLGTTTWDLLDEFRT